ncbi:MAG: FAS1 domain-containing protein [Monoraphidium minutum]|nr:MAG: FAS1 domain-containing protein [Monoraphidium minutum]
MRAASALALLVLAAAAHARPLATQAPQTVYDAVAGLPEVSDVFAMIKEAGLDAQFKNPKLGVTVFVPTNAALARALALAGGAAGGPPAVASDRALVQQALAYHLLNAPLSASDFPRGASLQPTVLGGALLQVSRDAGGGLAANGYRVVRPDVRAGQSVVHVVDGFLVAPTLLPALAEVVGAAAVARLVPAGVAAAAAALLSGL